MKISYIKHFELAAVSLILSLRDNVLRIRPPKSNRKVILPGNGIRLDIAPPADVFR